MITKMTKKETEMLVECVKLAGENKKLIEQVNSARIFMAGMLMKFPDMAFVLTIKETSQILPLFKDGSPFVLTKENEMITIKLKTPTPTP